MDDGKKKIIIIIIIIVAILLLLGGGIGLYFYLESRSTTLSKSSKIVQEENRIKISALPNIFYNNTVPKCDLKSCLKIGETILLNQLLTSTSNINNIIIKQTLNQEENKKALIIYGEEPNITTEDSSPYYLLLYNTIANIYRYVNLHGSKCKLVQNGLECNNRIIEFYGYSCIIDGNKYYCDLTYSDTNNYVILCDEKAYPIGIISTNVFVTLFRNNQAQKYLLFNIRTILVTNFSILVFDSNDNFIGVLSIL